MPKARQKKATHRVSHRHDTKRGTAGVALNSNMQLEIVFTKNDLPLLKRTVRILEEKRKRR